MLSDAVHTPRAGSGIGGLGANVRIYGAHHRFFPRTIDMVLRSLHHLLIFHRGVLFSDRGISRYSHRGSLGTLCQQPIGSEEFLTRVVSPIARNDSALSTLVDVSANQDSLLMLGSKGMGRASDVRPQNL